MILWLIFSILTLTVLGFLLFPLLRKQNETQPRVDYDIVVYRDQLAEVDMDIKRGMLTHEQAAATRTEIYRRMLAAEDAEAVVISKGLGSGSSSRSKLALALIILIAVPLGTGLMYAFLGNPGLPGKPYAGRKQDSDFTMSAEAEQLAAQLENNPDAKGYKRLADTYFMLHRYDRAVEAYHKIIDINGGNANIWSELGESIALSQDSMVVPEARMAFSKALQLDPHEARARFYLGLAETQINEPRRAVAIWKDLEKDSPPDAPWFGMVKEHITAFAKDAGFDPDSVTPMPPSLVPPHDALSQVSKETSPAVAPASVNRDAADAIMAMPPDEQRGMIHKMVDRLAEKMKNNPDDLDGWTRLANAYRVLGETDKAEAAEKKAEALKGKAQHTSSPVAPASVNPETANAIMAMPPDEQRGMIHKMVDRLAEKMKNNPDDLDGWTRLANAYRVLGETDKAEAAEKRAGALKIKAQRNDSSER